MRMISIMAIYIGAFLCFLMPAAGYAQQDSNCTDSLNGLLLQNLDVRVSDIFDSTESSYRYRIAQLVNSLHFTTHQEIINRELLFLSDSLITSQRLAESENNLRATGIFQRVDIVVDTISNSGANVTVSVKDYFTTQLNVSAEIVGGEFQTGIRIRDKNFAGRGYGIRFETENRKENRDFFLGVFVNPRVFGSRFVNTVKALHFEDADFQFYQLKRPFYSQETEWDFNTDFTRSDGNQFRYIRRNLYTKNNQDLKQTRFGVGNYFGNRVRMRLGFTYLHQSEQLSGPDVTGRIWNWKSRRISVSIGAINRTLSVWNNIDRSEIKENVHTGFLVNARAGRDVTALGADAARESYSGQMLYSRFLTRNEFLHSFIAHSLLRQNSHTVERSTSVRFSFVSNRFSHQTLAAKLQFSQIDSRRPFEQLFLGEDTGLRGYSVRDFVGNRLLLLNIEDRIFTNLKFWFIRFGGTVFFDTGKVWGSGIEFNSVRWHSSIGAGLRIGDVKSTQGIICIDAAYNLDRNRFSSVSISQGSYFQVLYPISF